MRRSLIYLLYWAVQAIAFPLLLLYLGLRIIRNPAYLKHLSERFGFLPAAFQRTVPGAIWLHAVSVGEALTAVNLIRRIRQTLPNAPVYVSCSTLAGRAMAEQKLAGLAASVFYCPLDYRFAVRRVLRALKPALVVVMETEIWPNLWRDARLSGAGLLVVNGRISDKALPRYRRFSWFFRAAMHFPEAILAQDSIAAARYRELGAAKVIDAGNLKYDFEPGSTVVSREIREFLERVRPETTWIAASTMPPAFDGDVDEDDVVLDAFHALSRENLRLLLVLVPRRPERFDGAAEKLEKNGISYVRRSTLTADSTVELPGVLLLDTIGELSGLFGVASVVFMGGSIAERGGHNILEPAAFGVPVIAGPHNENFQSIADDFVAGGGLTITTRETLAADVGRLLADEGARRQAGERAKQLADAKRGATARAVERIERLYDEALPRPFPSWPWRIAMTPLAWLWRLGVALDRGSKKAARLEPAAPVISVGNLAMGGTGKTPFVLWLARKLAERGLRPAILTRGYRRKDSSATLALLPGESAPVESTGEEAQIFVRAGVAAVGIGADRRASWAALAARGFSGVALLDDGFQHWALRRDVNIVLIDALDPFRGGVFPLGTSRESFAALRRADVVIITRAEPGRTYAGLRAEIRRRNPAALVLTARTVASAPEVSGRVAAFCGIGQPEAFRRTLASLGIAPERFEAFADHHHYTAEDLRPLAEGVDALLTTEKDLMNIGAALIEELKIAAVTIAIEVDHEEELLTLIESRITIG